MTLTQRIQERFFGRKSFSIVQANSWDAELQNIRRALGAVDMGVEQAYIQNDAVFSIVSRFVMQFQEPVIQVYDEQGEVIPQHPIRTILANPNIDTSEAELYGQIALYWARGGVAYLHKLRNQRGQLVGLRAYSSSQFQPQYNNSVVTSYIAKINGMPIQIPVDDVIFVPFPIRDELGRGIPPFLPSMMQVMTDTEASRYLYSVLKNDAVPRTVITQGGEMNLGNKDRERVKEEFAQGFGGLNRGKPVVLPSGANIQRISLSLQELTLDALRKVPEARLCAALQVPPELVGLGVGLENSTYSNKADARKSFVENTMGTFWRYCAEALERGLQPEFAETFELEFDTSTVLALQENQDSKQARVVTAWEKGVVTRNEARLMLGLEALPEQDVFIQDLAAPIAAPQLPVAAAKELNILDFLHNGGTAKQFFERAGLPEVIVSLPEAVKNHTKAPFVFSEEAIKSKGSAFCSGAGCTGEGCTNICPKNADFYTKEAVMEWKNWDTLAEGFSEKLQKSIAPVFAKLEKEILRNLPKAQKDLNTNVDLFDLEEFRDALAKATGSQVQDFLLLIARRAADAVNTSWDSIQDDFAKELGDLFGVSIERITGVADTLREELKDYLKTIADKPIAEVTAQLQEHFGNVLGSPARVARIARTTATAATAGSQRTTWQIAGFKVVWLTQRDGKVRPTHKAMDGQEVQEDGKFRYTDENGNIVEGDYPANMSTAGGSVNCRCYLRPIRR